MREFEYTVTDEIGLHARPAGQLCKLAKTLDSRVTLKKGEKSADASRVIAVMGMAVKKGDTLKITVDGGDEEGSLAALERFFRENL